MQKKKRQLFFVRNEMLISKLKFTRSFYSAIQCPSFVNVDDCKRLLIPVTKAYVCRIHLKIGLDLLHHAKFRIMAHNLVYLWQISTSITAKISYKNVKLTPF